MSNCIHHAHNLANGGISSTITTIMKNILQTTKLWKETIRKLKLIAALTNSSMVAVADRLVDEELRKLGHDFSTQDKNKSDD
jgi:hypothetical protein